MRRGLCLLCIIGFILFLGCTLPTKENSNNSSNSQAQTIEKAIPESITKNGDVGNIIPKTKKSNDSSEEVGKSVLINLYYQDREGTLIPVTRKVEKQEAIASLAIKGLVDNSLNREELVYYGIYPVLPKGTEVLGINVKEKIATIDFNDKLLDYSSEISEKSIIASIVYTLTEFKSIEKVKVLVKGRALSRLKFKTDISDYLSRANILINSEQVNVKQRYKKIDIYVFKNPDGKNNYIIPVSIELSGLSDNQLPAKIIHFLGINSKNKSFFTMVPANTELLVSEIKEGVLYLNLNRSIKNYGGNAREDAIIKQLLYSVKQLDPGIESVKFTIEGKDDILPEGTELSGKFKIPQDINNVIDNMKGG